MNYLRRIGHNYYFRLAIPKHLQSRLNSKEVLKSLKTADRRTAQILSADLLRHYLSEFDRMSNDQKITVDPKTGAVGVEGVIINAPKITPKLSPLPSSPEEYLEKLEKRFGKRIDVLTEEVKKASLGNVSKSGSAVHITDKLLSETIDEYVTNRINGNFWRAERTIDAHRNELAIFLEIVGDRYLSELTPALCAKYQGELRDWPRDYTKNDGSRDEYKAADAAFPRISPTHAQTRNGHVMKFLKWCKEKFYLEKIYLARFEVAAIDRTSASDAKDAFEVEDIKKIFGHKTFNSLTFTNDAYFFVPLLMVYSGLRSKEGCQLRVLDVKHDEEFGYFLVITDEGELQSVKNDHSRRVVPLHHDLIEYGFLDFVSATKTEYLFPKFAGNERAFQKWGNEKMLPSVGVKTNKKSMHTFRRFFGNHCEDAKISGNVIDKIRGHMEQDRAPMATTYGSRKRLQVIAPEYHEKYHLKPIIGDLVKVWQKGRKIKNQFRPS